MNLLAILFYFLYFHPTFCASAKKTSDKTIIVHAISSCPSQNRMPTKLSAFSFYNKHGKSIVNTTAEFTETLRAPLEIKVEGQRCEIHSTQCINIPGINYDKFCSVFGESYYGETYFSKLEPPITKCPVKKGIYLMKNVVIDHEAILKTIPFPTGRYKFTNVVYDVKMERNGQQYVGYANFGYKQPVEEDPREPHLSYLLQYSS